MVLLWIGIVLLAAWVLGFLVLHVAGGLIHLALLAGAVAIVWHFVAGRMHAGRHS